MKRIVSICMMFLGMVSAGAHEAEQASILYAEDTEARLADTIATLVAADTTAATYTYPTENHLDFSILGLNNVLDKGGDTDAPPSIDGGTGLYLGYGAMMHTPSEIHSKWWESTEFDLICACFQSRLSKRDAISLGVGCTWHFFAMSDGNRFVQSDEGKITVEAMPEGCNPGRSRIITFGGSIPLRYTHQFATNKSLLVGPVLEYYVYSRIRSDYKINGKKQKESAKSLHVNDVNVNFMAQYNMKYCGLFCRYAPFSVLDTNFGPKLGYLSFGLVLFPSF